MMNVVSILLQTKLSNNMGGLMLCTTLHATLSTIKLYTILLALSVWNCNSREILHPKKNRSRNRISYINLAILMRIAVKDLNLILWTSKINKQFLRNKISRRWEGGGGGGGGALFEISG